MKYIAIALYVAGAFVSGSQYHAYATERRIGNVYARTMLFMVTWPAFGTIMNVSVYPAHNGCEVEK